MARLTTPIKIYIVQGLATYRKPTEIAESVKEQFGVAIHRAQVAQYDPEGFGAGELAKKWKDLHAATRAEFLAATAKIGIAHRTYRLRELDENYRSLKRMKNLPAANAVLKQAAEEVGDVYTNKQRIDAKVQATARTVVVPAKSTR